MEEKNEKEGQNFSMVGLSLHIGFYIAATTLLFIAGGLWLDKRFGTLPLFIILGMLGSLAVTTLEVYRITRRLGKK